MRGFWQSWLLRVSLSVDKTPVSVTGEHDHTGTRSISAYVTVALMLVYSALALPVGQVDGSSLWLMAAVGYIVAIYLYYGIAKLAFEKRTVLLWGSSIAAIIFGYVLSGFASIWPLLAGWSMILSAAVISGRLTAARWNPARVYILSLLSVAVIITVQFMPLWSQLMTAASEAAGTVISDLEQMLVSLGYSQELIRDNLERTSRVFDAMIRITPALTIMSALLQFSIGYLLFAHFTDRKHPTLNCSVALTKWRVPFAVMPIVIVVIIARIIGNDLLMLIADNVLVCLSAYYCLAGLALIEYYMKKLKLSMLMKMLFYLLLFLTQLIGLFIAALLGFIDSFTNWRQQSAAEAA